MQKKKAEAIERYEKALQEEKNKNKIKPSQKRFKSVQPAQSSASVFSDHSISSILGHGSNRPTQESFFKLSKEKDGFIDSDFVIHKATLLSPVSTDFAGIFSGTQTATKNKVIKEEDENEDVVTPPRNGEVAINLNLHSSRNKEPITKEKNSTKQQQQIEQHDEDDDRFENLKQYLTISKRNVQPKPQTQPAEPKDGSPLKRLRDKKIVVSESKNPEELLKKNYSNLGIMNNRYVVTEHPISPIDKAGDEHSVDSQEFKAEVDVKETLGNPDENREYVRGESANLQ